VRDVKSEMLFLALADEISGLHAETMVKHVRVTVPLFAGRVMVQTDDGVEFSGTTRNLEGTHFRNAIKALGAEHC
jgi:hypothetical protein